MASFLAGLLQLGFRQSAGSLILWLLGILVLSNAAYRVRRWQRLRHVPGPPLAGWTSLWLTNRYINQSFSRDVVGLVHQYGVLLDRGDLSFRRHSLT